MKKRIQKYLAGEREGFSLVELIIVIAIMAILIGVIALAVIPNIQRSRESKDISFLDSVASATNAAIANNQISSSGKCNIFTIDTNGNCSPATANSDATIAKIQEAVKKTIAQSPTVGSTAAKPSSGNYYVTANWTIETTGTNIGAAKIIVAISSTSEGSTGVACNYLSDPATFVVNN